MTTENDPPLTDKNTSDDVFDDTDSMHFDDTMLEAGAPKRKTSPIVKIGGVVIVIALLGGGYYYTRGYYYTNMQSSSDPAAPIQAPVTVAENVDLGDQDMDALMEGEMPPQPDTFDDGMSDGFGMPVSDELLEADSDTDVIDPFGGDPNNEFGQDVAEQPLETDDSALQDSNVLAEDENLEIVEVENIDPDGMALDETAETNFADTQNIDDTDNMDAVPTAENDATTFTEKPMMEDELEDDQVQEIGFVEPLTPAETIEESPDANSLDEELQKQLLESLRSAPPTNTVSEVEVAPVDPTASRYEGQALGVAPSQMSRERALEEIEAPAMMRPKPKDFYVLRRESGPDHRNSKLVSARRALRTGRNEQALAEFDSLVASGHNNETIRLGRGVALQRLGQFEEALNVYEEILVQDPDNLDALTNVLGILALQSPGYSVDKLNRLHAKYPANVGITVQLALSKADAGGIREALDLLISAHRMDARNASIAYNLAVMYDRYGDKVNAGSFYRRSLILARDNNTLSSIPMSEIHTRLSTIR